MIVYVLVIGLLALYRATYQKGSIFDDYMDIQNTQSIKGIFTLLIFASHFVQYAALDGPLDAYYLQLRKYLGQMVVVPFLFYSGFGIEASVAAKGKAYVKQLPYKRIAKVLFQFDFAVLLFILLRYCMGVTYGAQRLLLTFLAWDGIANSNWYIFAILFLYIASWISHTLFPQKKSGACMCLAVLTTFFVIVMQQYKEDYWYNTAMAYVAGACFFHIRPRFDKYVKQSGKHYWLCLLGCSLYFAIFHKSMATSVWVYQSCAILFGLIVVLITMKFRIKNAFLDYCGKHLFSLYILQRLPMLALKDSALAAKHYLYFLTCVLLTFLLSWVFDAIVESLWRFLWRKQQKSEPAKNSILVQYLHEFWHYRDLLRLLVVKNVKLKYRRSWLGYVWSILSPLMVMTVMSIVFSTMFKRNIENYPVYLFCGQLLFNFMNTATTQSCFSISGNAALLKKTYVPKYLFTVAKITSALVDLLFSLGALVIVLLFTGHHVNGYALLFPFVLIQLYVFCIGLGLFLAQASVFFKDTQFIYGAVTTAWIYLTPIFYPIEALSEKLVWLVKHCNPMYFYIGQFRDLVYYGRMPGHLIILAGCGAAALMLLIGLWSFMRSKDKFILYI